jgi:ABC-type multidrug transport system ATPase subunit
LTLSGPYSTSSGSTSGGRRITCRIETIIGAYQDADPGRRTVFVSTHLISEFEGLIDEFTIIDAGREVLTLETDTAREQFQKIYVRFPVERTDVDLGGARLVKRRGRELELLAKGHASAIAAAVSRLTAQSPEAISTESLTLEEIFVSTLQAERGAA